MAEYVPVCPKCRKPFEMTRPRAPRKGSEADDQRATLNKTGVREGKCETHGWQAYPE